MLLGALVGCHTDSRREVAASTAPSLPAPRAPFMALEHEGSGPLGTSTCKGDLNNVCSFNPTPIIVGVLLRFHRCLKGGWQDWKTKKMLTTSRMLKTLYARFLELIYYQW